MDQHALAFARYQRVARGHVRGRAFMGTSYDLGNGLALLASAGQFLDDGGMICSHIAEQVIDADFGQPLQQEVRRAACLVTRFVFHRSTALDSTTPAELPDQERRMIVSATWLPP